MTHKDEDGLGDECRDDPPIENEYVEPPDEEYAKGYSLDYCFVSWPLFLTPKQSEEDWRHRTVFTICFILGKLAKLIIDPDASENLVSEKVVSTLHLKIVDHLHPYKLAWLANIIL